jgi:hypothetical protein
MVAISTVGLEGAFVRFGSLADIGAAISDVRSSPKAAMCGALVNVRFIQSVRQPTRANSVEW